MTRFGLFNTEAHTIEYVDETYQIGVWLPFSYATSEQRYPVLVVLDGDFAFGLATGLIPTLIGAQDVPELIVVGVGYRDLAHYGDLGQRRERDFLPPDFAGSPPDARTPQFMAFLQQKLFPLIETGYRASTEDRALFGFSAAGFFGLYAALTQPGMFRRCVVASCTWPGADAYLLARVEAAAPDPTRVYVAVGEHEADQRPGFDAVTAALRDHAAITVHTQVVAGEGHSAGVLANALVHGLRAVFGG